jgi:hypothetical protein
VLVRLGVQGLVQELQQLEQQERLVSEPLLDVF